MLELDRMQKIRLKLKKKRLSAIRQKSFVFLAICMYLDPDLDIEIALKLRLYCGLIGIDISSLAANFTILEVMRLHAIPQGASGFVDEYTEQGPGFTLSNHK